LDTPLQVPVIVVVHVFQVLEAEVFTQKHLVEWLREVAVKKLTVEESLAHHSTDELQVLKMVLVDTTVWVGVVRHSVGCQREQGVVWIEHLSRELNIKVSKQAADILAWLSSELDD